MNDFTMVNLMNDLSRMIHEKYTLRKIAKLSTVDRKTITRALECKNKYEMKLDLYLKVIKVLCEKPEDKRDMINKFISLVSSPLNIRKAFCYLLVSGEYELIDLLIEKHKDDNRLNNYISMFSLLNQRNKNMIKGNQVINEINNLRISSNDSEYQALLNLLYMVAMYDENKNNAVIHFGNEALRFIQEIEQEYIREVLYLLYKERIAYVYLLSDEIDKCRELCHSVIDSEFDVPMVKAVLMGCLGESYLYENLLVAEQYIEDALSRLKDINVPKKSQKFFAFKTTLAFMYIENNFNIQKIDFEYIHDAELANYECLYGDREKGLEIFRNLEQNSFSAHQLYSYSKVMGDIEGLRQALLAFERSGNLFYAKGVKRALMKDEVETIEKDFSNVITSSNNHLTNSTR
ncbi:TPA: hypothetical protein QCX53_005120 [Bacillus cereus]|nr:hypothetical protein [Bacillus cereus]